MAVSWHLHRMAVSSGQDMDLILQQIADEEEAGWDLEYCTAAGVEPFIMLFFKKKIV